MRVVAVIQARQSSRRLPGKILMNLRGRPSLDYLIEALAHAARLDGVVLATSTDTSDDATTQYAAERAIPCHRGSLDHVALRLLRAAEEQHADALVRINGDSPLLDPAVVDQGIELFRARHVDVVTNVQPRSFPKGQSVEVIAVPALRAAVEQMSSPHDREHVTPFLYTHPERFRIAAFVSEVARPEVQLSIDDADDFARCAAILAALPGAPWQVGWRACLDAYDRIVAAAAVGAQP
jgi:spore coat polysaccharide biosynthesis protein SpsF